jgi:SAM-dependent methyltransferase
VTARREGARAPSFADHFSATAPDYARFRPRYPAALFDWLVARVPAARVAWDCATGSGQAAVALADRVPLVVASDPSTAQLAGVPPHPRVHRLAATAERSGLRAASVDLLTVAQALHWFDLPAFVAEAHRVVRLGGVVAAWSYANPTITPAVDAAIAELYDGVLGPWWPPERRLVERGYADLPFPFTDLAPPPVAMTAHWTLAELAGYLGTWSATAAYRRARGTDPIAATLPTLAAAWGDAETRREVRWPLVVLAGRAETSDER